MSTPTLLAELKLYDPALLKKPRLVVANKMDLEAATMSGGNGRPNGVVEVDGLGHAARPEGSQASSGRRP